jgi:hypothetical protein
MYRVCYYINGSSSVAFKEYETLKEATDFSMKQPINSVLEIKQHDYKARDIQNESYDSRRSGLYQK